VALTGGNNERIPVVRPCLPIVEWAWVSDATSALPHVTIFSRQIISTWPQFAGHNTRERARLLEDSPCILGAAFSLY
jgi:hypothetical protein